MKEGHRTIILVLFIAVLIGIIIWARQVPETSLTQGL
jgi:hypothetical protein